ncbi:Acyl- synthetase family member 2 mitochondrial [Fusarium albosuccineum]|uniref:Acyl- synthetase family member 2 mitochondrial n=1 Tax=Fusarium albosuccineum TaxID=1237068 RepID=A0A8H4PJW2_9HYPO|nr:Acyl- synthetase family member 2 mitochondrial [Fusarium albosuccineum]
MLVDSMTPQLSEAVGDPCPTEPAVWQRLLDSASKYPNRLAVASLHQPQGLYGITTGSSKSDYLRWSYTDLKVAVDRFASSLWHLGARPGTALATFLDNRAESVIAYWAAHRLGCPLVPINPRTLINRDEAEHMLSTAGVSIVILQDVKQSHLLEAVRIKIKVFVSGTPPDSSWNSFSALMGKSSSETETEIPESNKYAEDLVTILFTSGTTSKPKGVPHTNTTLNAFCQNLGLGGTSHTNMFCSVLPNNHAIGYFFPLHFMMHGGAIVFPSPTFDASAMADALEAEQITHTAIVPTVLSALIDVIESRDTGFGSELQDVCLSGSSVTPENIRQVFTKLGSNGVSTGFGMTEGSPIWTASKKNGEDLIAGSSVISGPASRGACVRICAPGSRTPLPVGQLGEIHQTGPGTIKSYLGMEKAAEQFYEDEQGRTWFVTGDQALMHPDGRFSVTGRYKDMIIRGGENIAPAAIEAIISQHCNIQGYVVGAPDAIAGEIPVLVLPDKQGEPSADICDMIRRHLGPPSVPERTLKLSELGLEDVPRTTSAKVQKAQLASIVRDFLNSDKVTSEGTSDASVHNEVLIAYFKSTCVPVDKLDINANTSQFADSIAFMRVRDYLRKNIGRALSMKEMAEHPTITAQIKLLQDRAPSNKRNTPVKAESKEPPSLDELEILLGGVDQARDMVDRVSETLEGKGFSWSQVSAIIPTHDYMQVLLDSHIIDTWNFAIVVQANGTSVKDLRTALQKTLPYHPILTSFVVIDSEKKVHYVTLRAHEHLWNTCLIDHGSVDTVEEVQQMAVNFPRPSLSTMPGPPFSCLLIHIKETNSAAMIMYLHHIVQDASSLRLFLDDLNRSLEAPTTSLIPHTDFKSWADSYLSLRYSPAATRSVKFHVRRLRDLHKHKAALYPPAPVPRQAITENPDGLDHGFEAPGLIQLKQENPKIAAAVVLKAAMALVNVHRTGYSHSIFCNFEAGRKTFPFVPETVQAFNPDAFESSDVNGPVMQGVCNLIEVPRQETAMAFLDRLHKEQDQLTEHAHAPLTRIIQELNAEGDGKGDIIVEVHRTQFTTWVPGLLGEYDRIEVGKIAIRCAAGLVVVGALGGPNSTTYMLSMRWDVANYSRQETNAFVQDLQSAVLWLTTATNWDRPVIEFLQGIERN